MYENGGVGEMTSASAYQNQRKIKRIKISAARHGASSNGGVIKHQRVNALAYRGKQAWRRCGASIIECARAHRA